MHSRLLLLHLNFGMRRNLLCRKLVQRVLRRLLQIRRLLQRLLRELLHNHRLMRQLLHWHRLLLTKLRKLRRRRAHTQTLTLRHLQRLLW